MKRFAVDAVITVGVLAFSIVVMLVAGGHA